MILLSVCVRVCLYVCPSLRLIITSGGCGMIFTLYDWLTKFYSCYIMASVVGMANGHGLVGIDTCCGN